MAFNSFNSNSSEFGIDPLSTEDILQDVFSNLPTNFFPTRRSTIPLGFLKVMFRQNFYRYFHGRTSKRILQMILRRVAANLRFANYGRNYHSNGGIFKVCFERYSSAPAFSYSELSRRAFSIENDPRTYPAPGDFVRLLEQNLNPHIPASLPAFCQALTLSRPTSQYELPVMIYILRRTCEGIQNLFQIQDYYDSFTDECCDCFKSYYEDDNPQTISRRRTLYLLQRFLVYLQDFQEETNMLFFNRLKHQFSDF